jgi:hypothetical protein
MCALCRLLERAKPQEVRGLLEEVARRVSRGEPQEHFDRAVGEALGAGEAERDLEAEEAWERRRRSPG